MEQQIIQLKKYQQAMNQIIVLSDALFSRSAELEMAQIRITELEAQLKEKENGEQSSSLQNGTAKSANGDNESRRSNQNATA